MKTSIAIVEDDALRVESMRRIVESDLSKYSVYFFDNAAKMIEWLDEHLSQVALLSLDHDLLTDDGSDPGDGRDVADFLATKEPCCPVVIHTTNYYGREGMKYALIDAGWQVEIVTPTAEIEWIEGPWTKMVLKLLRNEI